MTTSLCSAHARRQSLLVNRCQSASRTSTERSAFPSFVGSAATERTTAAPSRRRQAWSVEHQRTSSTITGEGSTTNERENESVLLHAVFENLGPFAARR